MERTIAQRELAKVLGVNRSNLSELLSGKKRFGKNISARLEEITGIGLRTWLFGEPEEIRCELEKVYGRINFKRGRLLKRDLGQSFAPQAEVLRALEGRQGK